MDSTKKRMDYKQALTRIARETGNRNLCQRVEESVVKEEWMRYKNERHKKIFTSVIREMNKQDNKLMSAVYLLTADSKLWRVAKKYVSSHYIAFGHIPLKIGSEAGYTLLCCAKDLSQGTKYMTTEDLADRSLIPVSLFRLICTAMTIRYYGLEILHVER